mmetsp:Transcript_2361/g.4969  ORF Transcript_2361/g.4969 Transcript_2361/m.4969 type:complete len:100 (+) Transcript_2361:196-495(+)
MYQNGFFLGNLFLRFGKKTSEYFFKFISFYLVNLDELHSDLRESKFSRRVSEGGTCSMFTNTYLSSKNWYTVKKNGGMRTIQGSKTWNVWRERREASTR